MALEGNVKPKLEPRVLRRNLAVPHGFVYHRGKEESSDLERNLSPPLALAAQEAPYFTCSLPSAPNAPFSMMVASPKHGLFSIFSVGSLALAVPLLS